jgi:hypothetical protein
MIFPNPSTAVKNALKSNNSIQGFIDGKLPFKPVPIGGVYFKEEYSNTPDGSPITRGFDLVRNTTEDWTTTITKAPIENGDLRGVHQSFPNHIINITGVISQIKFEWFSQQSYLESEVRSTLTTIGKYAPKVARPVANALNKSLVKINKVKARAEGYLSDTRGFYQIMKNLKGQNTTYERKFVVFRDALILAQKQRQTFTIGIHGSEYNHYVLTKLQATQNTDNIYNMEFTLTFEYMPRVAVAKDIDPLVAKAVKTELAKYEAEAVKSSIGERTTILQSLLPKFS